MTANAALWFLPFVLPICLWVAWSDLAAMRIPNAAVAALLIVFALVGAAVLPLPDYLWRWTHFAVALAFGLAAFAAGAMGGGDAKFIAAASPFVAPQDLAAVLMLYAVMLLAGFCVHRTARAMPAVRAPVADWASWTDRQFPMGLPLGGTLLAYLLLSALSGA